MLPLVLWSEGMGWYVRMAVFISGKTRERIVKWSVVEGKHALTAHRGIDASNVDQQ